MSDLLEVVRLRFAAAHTACATRQQRLDELSESGVVRRRTRGRFRASVPDFSARGDVVCREKRQPVRHPCDGRLLLQPHPAPERQVRGVPPVGIECRVLED